MNRNIHVNVIIILLVLIAIYLNNASQPKPLVAYSSPFRNDVNSGNVTIQNNINISVTISAPNNISIEKIEGEQIIVGEKNIAHQINREGGEV